MVRPIQWITGDPADHANQKREERPPPINAPASQGADRLVRANKHRGSSFDALLREEAIFDEVQASAMKMEMARRLRTSRSQLERVLDPACTTVQLDTLIKAAGAVGRELSFTLKKPS